jgi:hypothetical protein
MYSFVAERCERASEKTEKELSHLTRSPAMGI